MKYTLLSAVILMLVLSFSLQAQIPSKVSYQGLLTTSAGVPVQDGSYDIKFEIFNLPSGGTLRHSETQNGVQVQKGTFSVFLSPPAGIFSESLYVEVTALAGPGIPSPITFSPRSELTSAPYSLAPWMTSGNNIYYNSGYVGIGTNTPLRKLHIGTGTTVNNVFSDVLLNHADADDHYYEVTNTSGFGLFGIAGANTQIVSSNNIRFAPGAVTAVTMTPAGNVGIGTATPSEKLEIAGTVKSNQFRGPLVVNGGNITYAADGGDHILTTATVERMRINGSGNVGIGTSSPNEQLEITGNLRLPASTASAGVIKSGANRFIHNFGTSNFFAGVNAGNFTLSLGTGGNTGVGVNALQALTTGYYNTAVGLNALYSNTTGLTNTAVGQSALYSNTTGNSNTALGDLALDNNTTGNYNTAIGYQADVSATGLSNATAIGYAATVDVSNKVRIGNTSVTSIGGQVGWSIFSDERLKTNVRKSPLGLDFILKLNPITYNYIAQGQEGITYTGLIAQHVEKVLQELGADFSGLDKPKNKDGYYQLRYAEFVMPLIKAIQEQQKGIEALNARNEKLEARLAELEALVKSFAANESIQTEENSTAVGSTEDQSLGELRKTNDE